MALSIFFCKTLNKFPKPGDYHKQRRKRTAMNEMKNPPQGDLTADMMKRFSIIVWNDPRKAVV